MKKETMFIIGMCSLAISIILGRFLIELPMISFFEGLFMGISLVMNIGFLIRYRLEKEDSKEKNYMLTDSEGNYLGKK